MIGQTISQYKILEKIGEGGMGIVYKAHDTKLDRTVALKFLSSPVSFSQENKTRFLNEARAAAALNHPHILSIYDIDEQDNTMFLVMEYINGKTLKSHISNLKSVEGISLTKSLDLAEAIARGLKAAHDKNIIHRDIKPENIMLSVDGNVKIMDFGLAKLKGGSQLTRTGTSLGTLAYMSPEQAQGSQADHRTDIWSFGILLYELLTGEVPFKGEHDAALLYLIVNESPIVPSSLDRKIPQFVDAFVMKLMEKDPDRRYQSMDEIIAEIADLKNRIQAFSQKSKTKTIVVLPFENISAEKDNEYFSDGLTEELIANLSVLQDIKIISRTTSMQYKGMKKDIKTIGKELGVRYILEGSVRRFQDNLRITAQLIDVESDTQLWAGTYKGKLEDVFDIQEQVAKQIVEALMVKLTPKEQVVLAKRPTLNAEAFDYNLRGRNFLYRLTKNNVEFAIQLFQKAIELDPRYASAYAGLGESYASLYQYFDRQDVWLDKGIESSFKALVYDSTLSEAHAALGLAYFNKKMIDDALTYSKKAIELDPNNHIAYWILARIYHTTDREHEAVELLRKVITINPSFYSAYSDLQLIYERLGETELSRKTIMQALDVLKKHLTENPDDARGHMFYAVYLARTEQYDEAKLEAGRAIELSPTDPLMMYNAACFYVTVGEKQFAVDTLKKAIANGYHQYEWIKRDTDLDPIRDEPGYVELMKDK
jgi:serine/threonine protein kinase/Flp pilus assembly protein TadD